jgi:hypothetical protein
MLGRRLLGEVGPPDDWLPLSPRFKGVRPRKGLPCMPYPANMEALEASLNVLPSELDHMLDKLSDDETVWLNPYPYPVAPVLLVRLVIMPVKMEGPPFCE